MKKLKILIATLILTTGLAGCSSTYHASAGYVSDDLYAIHDRTEIARKKQAQAEAQRAAAEARKAEWEARIAEAQAAAAENSYYEYRAEDTNPYQSVLADDYESAYARRLRGFESSSYKMPSSYVNARFNRAFDYASAYDPAFYNIIISGDQVWVEPKYVTSMFGSWGTVVYADPWYYGWNRPWGPSFSIGSWGWSLGWNSWYNPWYGPWGPWYSSWHNPWYGPSWGWGPGWHGHYHGPGWGPGWHGGHGRPYQSNIVRRPRPFGSSGSGTTTYNRRPGSGNSWNSGIYQGGNRGNRRTNSGTYNPSNTRPNRTNTYNNPGWDNSNRNQNSGRRSSSSGSSSYTPSYSAPASSGGGYSGGGGGGGSRSGGSTGSSSRGR